MLPTKLVRWSPMFGLLFATAIAGVPACAPNEEAETDESGGAAVTQDEEDAEDVASATAGEADQTGTRLVSKAVLGFTKLRAEGGKKRLFAKLRYFDATGTLIAVGIPRAVEGGTQDLALVRVSGDNAVSGATDTQLTNDARELTTRLLADTEAHGCSFGKGVVRAVGRFIGGLGLSLVGLVVATVMLPVALIVTGGELESADAWPFVDNSFKPLANGFLLVAGAFRPCRSVRKVE